MNNLDCILILLFFFQATQPLLGSTLNIKVKK
jgi:biopolymer transport protein ExbD